MALSILLLVRAKSCPNKCKGNWEHEVISHKLHGSQLASHRFKTRSRNNLGAEDNSKFAAKALCFTLPH